jgi:IS5 family transposase
MKMKQISLAISGFELVTKRTRKRVFLEEMSLVVPWRELAGLIQPFTPTGTGAKDGRPTFAVATMLRIHFLQQWFGLSDPAMEEALHDTPLNREFARLDAGMARMPNETSILRFRHLLEEHNLSSQLLATINATLIAKGLMLKTGTVVDATLIAAPSSTKNSTGERDPEMHQTEKGNQWHFDMKAHIGVGADSGLVHNVIGTAANVNDVTQGHGLLHGEETVVFADAGYQGSVKLPKATGVDLHVAMRPDKRRALNKNLPWGSLLDKAEQLKANVRAKVEHPFRVIKCQFGFTKVRYKGLAKNTAQLMTLFALSNVWMARRHLLSARG